MDKPQCSYYSHVFGFRNQSEISEQLRCMCGKYSASDWKYTHGKVNLVQLKDESENRWDDMGTYVDPNNDDYE